jgi:hypothetical protein
MGRLLLPETPPGVGDSYSALKKIEKIFRKHAKKIDLFLQIK